MARHPKHPTDLPKRAWWAALRRTVKEFDEDKLLDWAAALTYYSVLSMFPMIIVATALLGVVGRSATQPLIDNLQELAPGQARDVVINAVRQLEGSSGFAGPLAILSLLTALWAASGYVGAFIRAANTIYEVDEGRPIWKTVPLRVALTLAMVVLLAVFAVGVVATGGVARRLGGLFGVGGAGVLAWDLAKWPVLAFILSLAIALLYWAAPNVRHPGFRWLTPGSLLAVVVWIAASAGFAVYVANFGSYNKTYGSLAGVVVFLVWLWISNVAVLFGAEFDSELARGKSMAAGLPEGEEPYLPPRDTRAMDDEPDPGMSGDGTTGDSGAGGEAAGDGPVGDGAVGDRNAGDRAAGDRAAGAVS